MLGLRAAVWLQAKVRQRGLELRPWLNGGSTFETHTVVEPAYAACGAI